MLIFFCKWCNKKYTKSDINRKKTNNNDKTDNSLLYFCKVKACFFCIHPMWVMSLTLYSGTFESIEEKGTQFNIVTYVAWVCCNIHWGRKGKRPFDISFQMIDKMSRSQSANRVTSYKIQSYSLTFNIFISSHVTHTVVCSSAFKIIFRLDNFASTYQKSLAVFDEIFITKICFS